MADKLVLCISAERATVARMRAGKLGPPQSFDADPAGHAAFDRFLAGAGHAPVLAMVDAVEEEYRFETLPHATGSDRADLVGRRLKQLFRSTPYCAASLQGRDSGKRRDDQYLFVALSNPEIVSDWLKVVAAHDLPVAGLWLLPFAKRVAVAKLGLSAANLLLVSRNPSGLRLSFFREGQLRISRLTRAEPEGDQTEVAALTEEVANTRLYLHALRMLTLDEPLAVVVLDRDDTLADFADAVAREMGSNVQVARLGPSEVATRLGVARATLDASPDALWMHLLGLQAPQGNLAPRQLTSGYQQFQAKRLLHALAGGVAAVSLVWTGANLYRWQQFASEATSMRAQTTDYERRYNEALRGHPPSPTSADNMMRAIETAERLKKNAHSPVPALSVIGRVLEQHPQVVVKSIGWRYAPEPFGAQTTTPPAGAPGAAPAPPPAPGAPPTASTRRQSAFVEAELRPFDGDFKTALRRIDAFAEQLRSDPGVAEVRVIELPLNVSPTSALQGSASDEGPRATSAPFRLVLVFKARA